MSRCAACGGPLRRCPRWSMFAGASGLEDTAMGVVTSRTELATAGPDPTRGLTTAAAQQRRQQFGPNEIETAHRFWAVRSALEFSTNPLVLILLVASLISGVLG